MSRLKIDVKIDQKNDAVQDRFLGDFTGFWEGKWRHVGPKIEQKSMPTSKSDFLKNRALPAAGARFSRFWVSNLGIKINEKSIQKWNQDGKASWHRFLMDFGGFLEASWEGKSSQDRTRQDKTGQDRTRQDKTKTRQDKTLTEKERRSLKGAGGGGVHPAIRGILHWKIPPRLE